MIPTRAYARPVIIRIAPAKPIAGVIFGCKGRGSGSPRVVPFAVEVEVMTDPVVVPEAEGISKVAEIEGGTEEAIGADDVPDPLDLIELSLEVWLRVLLAVPVGDVVDAMSVEDALTCLI